MAAPNPPPRSAWVLLALLAAEGHSLTPVQLQKCLFLLGSRRPKDVGRDFYHFRPYDYGPFDVMGGGDRKSTRLNSSHVASSYAVFCLKKKIYFNCES